MTGRSARLETMNRPSRGVSPLPAKQWIGASRAGGNGRLADCFVLGAGQALRYPIGSFRSRRDGPIPGARLTEPDADPSGLPCRPLVLPPSALRRSEAFPAAVPDFWLFWSAMSYCELVVEDDAGLRLGSLDSLRVARYGVRTAGDGEAALGIAFQGGADAIVLDVMLPGVRDGGRDVWKSRLSRSTQTVDAHVASPRRKLGDNPYRAEGCEFRLDARRCGRGSI